MYKSVSGALESTSGHEPLDSGSRINVGTAEAIAILHERRAGKMHSGSTLGLKSRERWAALLHFTIFLYLLIYLSLIMMLSQPHSFHLSIHPSIHPSFYVTFFMSLPHSLLQVRIPSLALGKNQSGWEGGEQERGARGQSAIGKTRERRDWKVLGDCVTERAKVNVLMRQG
jgi:hypothetical protein